MMETRCGPFTMKIVLFVKEGFQRTDIFHCTCFKGLQRVKFIKQFV